MVQVSLMFGNVSDRWELDRTGGALNIQRKFE